MSLKPVLNTFSFQVVCVKTVDIESLISVDYLGLLYTGA
jgi:hypothetical protein